MAGEPSDVRRFDASFKKVPGTLSVTPTHIAWVPTERDAMDRQNQAMSRAINMLASKAGSAKVSLVIKFKDDIPAGGLHFQFTNPTTKDDDRKTVQDILIPFVSANKLGAPAASTPATPADIPAPTPSTSAAAAVMSANAKGKRKAEDASPGTNPGVGSPSVPPAVRASRKRTNLLRTKVLEKNPTLMMLHRELVLGKQITEEEFWYGREALIQAEEMAYAQKPGRPSRLLDDRFDLDAGRKGKTTGGTGVGIKTADNGPIVLKLSKELTREIFEEFPVVQDAYAKYVPGISETEFWSRYFTSQLWERHRASVRKSANDEVSRKKDDIFDQYLEEPDWNLQPRQNLPDRDGVERFLDLAATEEDHGESITVRDVTMQAGRERSALPLIRRFNDHSKKLLRAADAGRDQSALSDSLYGSGIDIYNEIDYEDLRGPAQPATITLDVQDAGALADSAGDKEGPAGILPGKTDDELVEIAAASAKTVHNWHPDFSTVCLPNPGAGRPDADGKVEVTPAYKAFVEQRDAQAAAFYVVKDLHRRSNAENAVLPAFPDNVYEQMRSCHNAATEFLRQYWSAIMPTQQGALGLAGGASAKEAKAVKMAAYLKNTKPKVEAIVQTAQILGFDPERVRKAMAPTMGAVNVALEREAKRVGKAT
ncbi:hypothetical protein CI109_101513 [Kwoniella shandongensis]|uniref:Uncharacterized protein n=1 Tax=Kwoniella shandongensis TaxID=1734106 RepID=A0A5M6C6U3_9TREE|nr:uncharacterized protein CI109_001355 [Kwoniella shandongensis]KAA5530551.1 hypothetical protein CI109_001355 [Kwoniella shandongensis]